MGTAYTSCGQVVSSGHPRVTRTAPMRLEPEAQSPSVPALEAVLPPECWQRVRSLLADQAVHELGALVEYGFRSGAGSGRVEELSRVLRVPHRTLASHLAHAGRPCPRTVLAWCIVLRAADQLCHTSATVEQVADSLGFAAPYCLRRLFRRYLGTVPRQFRDPDAWNRVVAAFLEALAPRPLGPHGAELVSSGRRPLGTP